MLEYTQAWILYPRRSARQGVEFPSRAENSFFWEIPPLSNTGCMYNVCVLKCCLQKLRFCEFELSSCFCKYATRKEETFMANTLSLAAFFYQNGIGEVGFLPQ